MTSQKPTIVFVSGAFHKVEGYAPTTDLLKQDGYDVIGVTLASVDQDPPQPNWDEDIAGIERYQGRKSRSRRCALVRRTPSFGRHEGPFQGGEGEGRAERGSGALGVYHRWCYGGWRVFAAAVQRATASLDKA
jgi:hypothetical protein